MMQPHNSPFPDSTLMFERFLLRCMRQQIAVFVDAAALHRNAVPNRGDRILKPARAVDDEELRPSDATLNEIVEHRPPGLGAFAAHALDCEQNLLAAGAHPHDDQQRDRCGLAIQPHAHHGAIEDEPHDRLIGQRPGIPSLPVALHLAPNPAAHGKPRCTRKITNSHF